MLTIYRSNRAEWLATLLAEQLRLHPPELLETVDIVVKTWPTGRWVSEQIASTNHISALVKFPFPGIYLKELVQKILSLDISNNDPWNPNELKWSILKAFPLLLESDKGNELKEWLDAKSYSLEQLKIHEWQLAKSIANTFEDYLLYRPELINHWWEDSGVKNENFEVQSSQYQWQKALFKILQKQINKKPFALYVKEVIAGLKRGAIEVQNLPSSIQLFGINSLAPIQIELIQAISCLIDVKIFLVTPSKDLWQRCKTRREELDNNRDKSTKSLWILKAPRLEANLGRLGSEFEQLLEGSGEYQLGEWSEKDLFASPITIAKNNQRDPTLLEQLQEKLITNKNSITLKRNGQDNSLLFFECPGQKRQVQIIRDQIIQLLAKDETLEPKDILIMTPQVEEFAPLISSVFNDVKTTNVENYIKKGDFYFSKGDLVKARKEFDKARSMSKQLLGFYRDLSSSFKGLDARIPREMDSNGRIALEKLAKVNLRLAALFRKKNQPEVAVPLLIEVVRVMSPAKAEGQKAYQTLVELGFADTPYGGARKSIY